MVSSSKKIMIALVGIILTCTFAVLAHAQDSSVAQPTNADGSLVTSSDTTDTSQC